MTGEIVQRIKSLPCKHKPSLLILSTMQMPGAKMYIDSLALGRQT